MELHCGTEVRLLPVSSGPVPSTLFVGSEEVVPFLPVISDVRLNGILTKPVADHAISAVINVPPSTMTEMGILDKYKTPHMYVIWRCEMSRIGHV
jgi:hypothetical protein